MGSSILFSNLELNIILIDIPRSIELVQGFSSSHSARLFSSPPIEQPFPSLEPKSAKAKAKAKSQFEDISLENLLTQKFLSVALNELRKQYTGPWCLPRVTKGAKEDSATKRKRKGSDEQSKSSRLCHQNSVSLTAAMVVEKELPVETFFYQNPDTKYATATTFQGDRIHLPPQSYALCGSIEATTLFFLSSAPKFNFITLDPPWPNRSARRKDSYNISYKTSEIRNLLYSLPLKQVLAADGLVAIWITNKSIFREMVISDGGLFDHWGVTLVEEWIWLKTTTSGVPISTIDGVWRKPYEVLLVGRKSSETKDVKKRVIVGVPDLHSRKPNLKELVERVFGFEKGKSLGLEVFARNLTEGWWAWGDECLKFQGVEHWSGQAIENTERDEVQ